jgi:hypothetical protein
MLRTQRVEAIPRIDVWFQGITQAMPLSRIAPFVRLTSERIARRRRAGARELHGKRVQLPHAAFAAVDHAIERCAFSNTVRPTYYL